MKMILKTMRITMAAAFLLLLSSTAFGQVTFESAHVSLDAMLADILEIKIIEGGELWCKIETKDDFNNGVKCGCTKIAICATCDWELKCKATTKPGEYKGKDLPLDNFGKKIKIEGKFKNYIQNNAESWTALSSEEKVDLRPAPGKSNIGDKIYLDVCWALGTKKGTMRKETLLDQQIPGDNYLVEVWFTLCPYSPDPYHG